MNENIYHQKLIFFNKKLYAKQITQTMIKIFYLQTKHKKIEKEELLLDFSDIASLTENNSNYSASSLSIHLIPARTPPITRAVPIAPAAYTPTTAIPLAILFWANQGSTSFP